MGVDSASWDHRNSADQASSMPPNQPEYTDTASNMTLAARNADTPSRVTRSRSNVGSASTGRGRYPSAAMRWPTSGSEVTAGSQRTVARPEA